jgi:hypothetical protein
MSVSLLIEHQDARPIATELHVRRRIDRSMSRALVDTDYACRLLTDPTIALGQSGCSPQQFKSLRSIHARDLDDFARQAHALFWKVEPTSPYLEEQFSLAAAVAR